MKTRIALILAEIVLRAVTASLRADEKTTLANAQRLEAIKQLAGDWVEVGKDGKPTDRIVSSIRVTSAGSAVLETLFPGTDHEMVTMYHMDGEDLIHTPLHDGQSAADAGRTRRRRKHPCLQIYQRYEHEVHR